MTDQPPPSTPEAGKTEDRPPVSDSELRAAFAGSAVHVNKMYAVGMGQNVRLTFMEQLGDTVPPQFRAAVMMSYTDMVALRDLLSRQMTLAVEVKVELGPDGRVVIKDNG